MELSEYMNDAIGRIFRDAMFSSRFNAKELRFLNKAVKAQKEAAQKRSRSNAAGTSVPPFLIASIATKCNLHCEGCYARANKACKDESAKGELDAERWSELFSEAKALGVSFILLAGGEPLERPDVLDQATKTPELIFPVFTNGTLFDQEMLEQFDNHRNLVPVISMEGDRDQTDRRRGNCVFETVLHTTKNLSRLGIFYGVSITVTKDNLGTVTDEAFLSDLR
ncbi:MAG: radical SAM protein, partial [Clostridia bacterium]|nr:radical SAM protein [Clostridia bacterium]